jgi:hypothetical protein
MVETSDPALEIKPAFDVIGEVLETFITISDVYYPTDSSFTDNVNLNIFISRYLLLHHLIPYLILSKILKTS